jgi:uncharacterized protein YciI
MNSIKISCLTAFASLLVFSCQPDKVPDSTKNEPSSTETAYDSTLAAKWGADEYGMRTYVLAFVNKGPNRSQDSATTAIIQKSHLDNITRLANEGKIALAGPFLDDWATRGIFIYNVKTIEEAEALFATDPATKAGRIVAEYHLWYGSAALMTVNDLHKKISKNKI